MKKNTCLFGPDSTAVVSLPASTEFSAHGIVSRALVSVPGLRVTLFGFAEGQELTEHASSSRAIVQVLTGKSEWLINGAKTEVAAGEVLHMPPGTRHAVRAVESFSMLLTLAKEAGGPSHE